MSAQEYSHEVVTLAVELMISEGISTDRALDEARRQVAELCTYAQQ